MNTPTDADLIVVPESVRELAKNSVGAFFEGGGEAIGDRPTYAPFCLPNHQRGCL